MFSKRGFLIFASCAVASSAFAQGFEQKISFEARASTTTDVLKSLSEKTGITFRTNGFTAKDVIAVRVKNTSVLDIVEGIAKATGSSWLQEEDGWRLVRGDNDENRQRGVDLQTRAKLVTEAIKKEQDKIRSQFDVSGYIDGVNKATRTIPAPLSPGQRAIVTILSTIKPADIAGIWNERLVYATSPTKMQRPLGGAAANAIQQYVRDELALLTTMGANSENRRIRYQPNIAIFANQQVKKAHLILHRQGDSDILCTFTLIGQNGAKAVETAYQLRLVSDQKKAAVSLPGGVQPSGQVTLPESVKQAAGGWSSQLLDGLTDLPLTATQFVISDQDIQNLVSNELVLSGVTFTSALAGGQEVAPIAADLKTARASMTYPAEIEPLSGHPTDLLWSMYGDANVIACLPDTFLFASAQYILAGGEKSMGSLWETAINNWGLARESYNELEILRPADLSDSRDRRVNRQALQNLIRSVLNSGDLRLEPKAQYALSAPYKGDARSLDVVTLGKIRSDFAVNLAQVHGEEGYALRLFGSINAQERERIAGSPNGKPINSLNSTGEQNAFSLVFNTRGGPNFVSLPASSGQGGRPQGQPRTRMLNVERTDYLTNGIPAGAVLTIEIRRSNEVRAIESATGRSSTMNPNALGSYRAMMDNPANADRRNRMTQYNAFVPVGRVDYTLTLVLDNGVTLRRSLTDMAEAPGANPAAYDSLPNDIRRVADESYKRANEQMRNNGRNNGNNGRP